MCSNTSFFFFNLMSLDALSAEISLLCSLGQIILFYTYFYLYFGLKKICHKYLLSSSLCAKLGMQNVFIVQTHVPKVSHTLVFRSHSSLF